MKDNKQKKQNRVLRKNRVRIKIKGTSTCPRVSVFRSNKYIYAQLIDDSNNKTILSINEKEVDKKENEKKEVTKKVGIAYSLGSLFATKVLDKKIENVVFDKSWYKYHGRIKAFADGARDKGLKF